MKFKTIFLLLLSFTLLAACTNDSNDDGNNDSGGSDDRLSQNACSTLNLGTRIVSGTECSENNSPVVEIVMNFPGGATAICTGTMITSEWVLTAAHCFFENPSSILVTASGVSVAGRSYKSHPDVRVDNEAQAVYNDVALVRLASPVSLPTLPILGSRAAVKGEQVAIFGYGITEDQTSSNDTSGRLRSGEMKISESNSSFIDARFDGEGSNTCSGDSGGPALLEVNGQQAIAGITSSGIIVNCSKGDVSRFTNVQNSSVLNFITSNVGSVRVI